MCHPRYALWIVLIWICSFALVRLAATWIPGMDGFSDEGVMDLLTFRQKILVASIALMAAATLLVVYTIRRRRP